MQLNQQRWPAHESQCKPWLPRKRQQAVQIQLDLTVYFQCEYAHQLNPAKPFFLGRRLCQCLDSNLAAAAE